MTASSNVPNPAEFRHLHLWHRRSCEPDSIGCYTVECLVNCIPCTVPDRIFWTAMRRVQKLNTSSVPVIKSSRVTWSSRMTFWLNRTSDCKGFPNPLRNLPQLPVCTTNQTTNQTINQTHLWCHAYIHHKKYDGNKPASAKRGHDGNVLQLGVCCKRSDKDEHHTTHDEEHHNADDI